MHEGKLALKIIHEISSKRLPVIVKNILDGTLIGEGLYGFVYQNTKDMEFNRNNSDSDNEVIKIFKMSNSDNDVMKSYCVNSYFSGNPESNKFLILPKRISILNLNHPANCHMSKYAIVYNKCETSDNIRSFNSLKCKDKNFYAIFEPFRNILLAIKYLSSLNLTHYDIKFNNIVKHDGIYKLIDLDLITANSEKVNFLQTAIHPPFSFQYAIFDFKEVSNIIYSKGATVDEKIVAKYIPDKYQEFKYKILHQLHSENKWVEYKNWQIENCKKYGHAIAINEIRNRIDVYSFGMLILHVTFLLKDEQMIDFVYDCGLDFFKLCLFETKSFIGYELLLVSYARFLGRLKREFKTKEELINEVTISIVDEIIEKIQIL